MKIKIELSPFDALAIQAFLDSAIPLAFEGSEDTTALRDSVKAYKRQIFDKMPAEGYKEAKQERVIHISLGHEPKMRD